MQAVACPAWPQAGARGHPAIGGIHRMALVSIGIPVYNGEEYLAETLKSGLAQSVDDFEIVVSDNASTDRTSEICRSYQAKDPRIRYYRNDQNIGGALNFNRVFELSRAPLFHCGACDDLYEPLFLERCVDALDRDAGVVLSHARTKMIGEKGEPLLFDPERNCYIGSYGNSRGVGRRDETSTVPHRGGGQPRDTVQGRALADGLGPAAERGHPQEGASRSIALR